MGAGRTAVAGSGQDRRDHSGLAHSRGCHSPTCPGRFQALRRIHQQQQENLLCGARRWSGQKVTFLRDAAKSHSRDQEAGSWSWRETCQSREGTVQSARGEGQELWQGLAAGRSPTPAPAAGWNLEDWAAESSARNPQSGPGGCVPLPRTPPTLGFLYW